MKLSSSPLPRGLRVAAAALVIGAAAGLSLPALARPHGEAGTAGVSGMAFHERMLDSVGVSADQKAQIRAIFQSARTDLGAQRASAGALRAQALQNFAAPTVDANAAELLRQQMQAQRDAAGRRMLAATVAAANVLTPAQRQGIAAKITQRMALSQKQRSEREALYRQTL